MLQPRDHLQHVGVHEINTIKTELNERAWKSSGWISLGYKPDVGRAETRCSNLCMA
jgi:hypothetical protein